MLSILPLNEKVLKKLQKHTLEEKFDKQVKLILDNPRHPSLNVELLEPKQYGVYSFRINKKFRALFIFRTDVLAIEVLNITLHYHR